VGLGMLEQGPVVIQNRNNKWDANFQELVSIKNEYGHCNMLSISDKDHNHNILSNWVGSQRHCFQNQQYYAETGKKKRCAILTEEQKNKLASIGFQFKVKNDSDECFEQLVDYKKLWSYKSSGNHGIELMSKPSDDSTDTMSMLLSFYSWSSG
jgi:hypothetical protein